MEHPTKVHLGKWQVKAQVHEFLSPMRETPIQAQVLGPSSDWCSYLNSIIVNETPLHNLPFQMQLKSIK